jgi:hypothetical protein
MPFIGGSMRKSGRNVIVDGCDPRDIPVQNSADQRPNQGLSLNARPFLSRITQMRSVTVLRTSLAALALSAAVACGDTASPTAPSPVPNPSLLGGIGTILNGVLHLAVCSPHQEQWKTATIGSSGGTINLGDGTVLAVPAGALPYGVSITAHELSGTAMAVEFAPEGLHFAVPAKLTLSYAQCLLPPLLGPRVVYLKNGVITEIEPLLPSLLSRSVTASISHFSSYAVAY